MTAFAVALCSAVANSAAVAVVVWQCRLRRQFALLHYRALFTDMLGEPAAGVVETQSPESAVTDSVAEAAAERS